MQTFRKTIQSFLILLFIGSSPGFHPYDSQAASLHNEHAWVPLREYAAYCPGSCPHATSALIGPDYLYGVINNDGHHYTDEWQHGVRATTFEFQWQLYEPQEGVFDTSYIQHMKDILAALKAQGWFVQMIPGIQYTPQWVYNNYPDMVYVNQYGDRYNPDPTTQGSFRTINAPFNPQARQLIAVYLDRIFQDFDQSDPSLKFDSIRVGGGVQGELRYPPANWNGNTNSYWAFDRYAQDPNISGIPAQVVGWRPGIDANPGSVDRGQLLINPGFEQMTPEFPLFGWTPDPQVSAIFTTTLPKSGARSLELTLTTPNRMHQFIPVYANTTYQFHGWLRTGQANSLARVFLSLYSAINRPQSANSFSKLESGGTTWSEISASITTTADTRFIKIELDGDKPGVYFFDNLQIEAQNASNSLTRDITVPLEFYDWYVKSLTDYQNWQISELRAHSSAQLDIIYAGKGLLNSQLTDVLNNDLNGDSYTETGSALYAGSVYERHIQGLPADPDIALFLTGIEDPSANSVDDNSPYPNDWSAAHWLSGLAKSTGHLIWGENSGRNNLEEMSLALQRMRQNGFSGIMWGFESELYSDPNPNGYANITDYAKLIAAYPEKFGTFIPLCLR